MGAKMALVTSVIFTLPAHAATEHDYLPANTISMPVYTVINDALKDALPLVNGKVNEPLMRLICDLARGDKSQDEIDLILTRNKVIIDSIPASGNPLSLLVNHDIDQQRIACAAWLASSLRERVNLKQYKEKMQPASDKNDLENNKWPSWFTGKKKNTEKKSELVVWDKERFNEEAITQMALAKATAQFYALIANDLLQKPFYSFDVLEKCLRQSIKSYSAAYLSAIKVNYKSLIRNGAEVKDLSSNYYKVVDNKGSVLIRDDDNAHLSYQNVSWLGDGKIIGKEYFVEIKLSSEPIAEGGVK